MGFRHAFTAEQPGLHTAVAVIERHGKTVKSDPLSFFVKTFTAERLPRPANVDLLRSLARRSGGTFFRQPQRLARTLAGLTIETKDETRVSHSSLWRKPLVIACLICLLVAEWTIRKWRHMA